MSLALVREEAIPSSSSAFQAVAALREELASTTSGNGAAMVALQGGGTVQDITSTVSGKGAALVGYMPSGGAARNVQQKLQEWSSLKDAGAVANGSTDDAAAVGSAAASASSIVATDGTYQLGSGVSFTVPKSFVGSGPKTLFRAAAGFAAGPIFTVSPAVGSDPKNWSIEDFGVTNQGAATSVFKIDLTTGKYISKFTLRQIVSNTPVSSGRFVELSNVNIDGLFTSLFEDNWSFGGYYMDNIGDSVMFNRNTTTGAGVGYYINQLGTAANIAIRDGNCTSLGGALSVVKGANITFENMQCELPGTFTGVNNALVSLDHSGGNLIFNTKIIGNNLNTKGNCLYCLYLQETDLTLIEGNQFYCDPATGAHIYIDSAARGTIIRNNKYYNALTGVEIDPIIVDNGIGTVGVWKNATLTLSGWTAQGTANEHPPGFFKDRDGNIQLRGRVAGGAATSGDTLFTLPVGFRPKSKGYLIGTYGAAGGSDAVVLQITPTGAVQILTAGATGVYLSGVIFSTQ